MPKPALSAKIPIKAKLWLWPGNAAWHFVTLPKKTSTTIKTTFSDMARGFGSLPVTVTIGKTTWETSIFPDSKAGAYLLPIKAAVRKAEQLRVGDSVSLSLRIRV